MENTGMKNGESNEFENYYEKESVPKCCFIFDPSHFRFIALTLVCIINFCSLAAYDTPGSLETEIEETFSIKPYQFEYLYSVYCFPNIILSFFSGVIIDRVLGLDVASLIITVTALIAQIIFTIGGFVKIYWILLLARFIFGVGGDSIIVVVDYYCVLWFGSKELNFVFGIQTCIARLGTSFIYLVATPLYKYFKDNGIVGAQLGSTFSFSIVCIGVELLCVLALAWITKRNRKILISHKEKEGLHTDEEIKGCSSYIQDIFSFPLKFWLLAVIFLSFNTAILVFVTCSQKLLMLKYGLEEREANSLGSVYNMVMALSSPLAGLLVDKVGRQLYVIQLSLFLGAASQIILALTSCNPYVPIIIFGLSCGVLYSCVMSVTSLVVPPHQLASAFGMSVSLGDLFQTVFNIVAGYLLGRYGYQATCFFYSALLLLGLLGSIFLWICDKKDKGNLNLSASQKKSTHV